MGIEIKTSTSWLGLVGIVEVNLTELGVHPSVFLFYHVMASPSPLC